MAERFRTMIALISLFAGIFTSASCAKAPPPDPLCRYEPIPESAGISSGKAALVVTGSSGENFYAHDPASGAQVGYARVNNLLALAPGQYQAKINGSVHTVTAQAGTATRCESGLVMVRGGTDEYYYVLDEVGTQLAYAKEGKAIALFPGKYRIRINNTLAPAEVRPGGTTELTTGTVQAMGTTGEYFYIFDSVGTQLAYSRLGTAISLMPGNYVARINNTTSPLSVSAESEARVPVGSVSVEGATDEYYYVLDSNGTQLAYAKLGRPLAFVPGSYALKVNNTRMAIEVRDGELSKTETGTLVVRGTGSDYFYVLDSNGTQLGYSKLNSPLSVFPGKYSVKVKQDVRPVEVGSARVTAVTR